MTATLVTSGIDQVLAEPAGHWGWAIRFRSGNVALHHQLYVNGRLADWTDTPQQRCFVIPQPAGVASIRVAAVEASARTTDLGEQLPPEERQPPWTYRPQVVRPADGRPGEVLEILSDHATGQLSDVPVASAEVSPAWVPRWAFGDDPFGQGGFGYDGVSAPGLGQGAFGAGLFGMGADLIDVEAELREEGTHEIVLRTRRSSAEVADRDPIYLQVAPPPAPPAGLTPLGYDQQAQQLQLEIN